MKTGSNASSTLAQFFALSYLLLLINASAFLGHIHYMNFSTYLFAGVVYLSYSFLYILPILFLFGILQKILSYSRLPLFLKSPWFIGPLAVIAATALQILIYTDYFVFKIFGFHFNSFVWNLIFTKGGIDSMGSSQATMRSFIMVMLFFFIAEAAILVLLMTAGRVKKFCDNLLSRRRLIAAAVIIAMLFVLQFVAFGISSLYNYSPVLTVSQSFPFYVPVTFRKLVKSFGLKPPRQAAFDMKFKQINLRYPLNPINQKPDHKNYNIVILMAESLRADMLDPQIMPKTWAFSQQALRFTQHYSGGNGTRMAMFGAFYGLYGNYWFKFLDEQRGPVFIDLLLNNNYQMSVYSSAKFSYPEFDKTIFARLPQGSLHDSTELDKSLTSWQFDRLNVDRLLDFLEHRDKSRPFMTFMFFESPHAPYNFPPENEIRTPYLKQFDYASVDLKKDIQLVKNRYINSSNHLDGQYERVFKYLRDNSLLDSTIVILTGDHGEEFMEHDRWGHNSDYSDEQTIVPMVLWAPTVKPGQINSMTSHLDIPTTILNLLGVTNLPQDYSQGFDMLGNEKRRFTVISDWDAIVYVDGEYKATFPMNVFSPKIVTTKSYVEISDKAAFYQTHQLPLVEIMKGLSNFSQ